MGRLGFLTNNGHPNLYFDFAESSEANAVAFNSEGWAMIGISTALMTAVDQMMASLSQNAIALDQLGLKHVYKDSELGRNHLESLLFRFIAAHEMGHHVRGHLGDTSLSFAVREEIPVFQKGDKTREHILELEADAYAVESIVRPILRKHKIRRWMVAQIFDMEEDSPELNQHFACALLAAVATYFLFVEQPPFAVNTVKEVLSHPPRLVRLAYIKNEISKLLSIIDPGFELRINEKSACRICSGARADRDSRAGMPLEQQIEFAESESCGAYTEHLDRQRTIVTSDYLEFAWKPNFNRRWKSPDYDDIVRSERLEP